MIHTYSTVAQMDDTRKPGTFTQWNCDCGKTTTTSNLQNCKIEAALNYTANVNRQTTGKLLFSYAIITGENV